MTGNSFHLCYVLYNNRKKMATKMQQTNKNNKPLRLNSSLSIRVDDRFVL